MEIICCNTNLGDVVMKVNQGVLEYLQFETYEKHRKENHPFAMQVKAFSRGESKHLEIPYKLSGTAFQKTVWAIVAKIPYGKTTTYGHIAKELGDSKKVRAVGAAVGANPVLVILPCHRVIAVNGALQGYAGGLENKQKLLTIEGVLQQTQLF